MLDNSLEILLLMEERFFFRWLNESTPIRTESI